MDMRGPDGSQAGGDGQRLTEVHGDESCGHTFVPEDGSITGQGLALSLQGEEKSGRSSQESRWESPEGPSLGSSSCLLLQLAEITGTQGLAEHQRLKVTEILKCYLPIASSV